MVKQTCDEIEDCIRMPSESSPVFARICKITHMPSCRVYRNSEEKRMRYDDDL